MRGVQLVKGDELVGVEVIEPDRSLLTITTNGYGKRTPIEEYRVQNRGGIGLIDIKTEGRNGSVVGVVQVDPTDQLMIVTSAGKIIRTRVDEVSILHRNTMGVRMMRLDKGEQVVAFSRLTEDQVGDESEDEEAEADGAEGDAAPSEGSAEGAGDVGEASEASDGSEATGDGADAESEGSEPTESDE